MAYVYSNRIDEIVSTIEQVETATVCTVDVVKDIDSRVDNNSQKLKQVEIQLAQNEAADRDMRIQLAAQRLEQARLNQQLINNSVNAVYMAKESFDRSTRIAKQCVEQVSQLEDMIEKVRYDDSERHFLHHKKFCTIQKWLIGITIGVVAALVGVFIIAATH